MPMEPLLLLLRKEEMWNFFTSSVIFIVIFTIFKINRVKIIRSSLGISMQLLRLQDDWTEDD